MPRLRPDNVWKRRRDPTLAVLPGTVSAPFMAVEGSDSGGANRRRGERLSTGRSNGDDPALAWADRSDVGDSDTEDQWIWRGRALAAGFRADVSESSFVVDDPS